MSVLHRVAEPRSVAWSPDGANLVCTWADRYVTVHDSRSITLRLPNTAAYLIEPQEVRMRDRDASFAARDRRGTVCSLSAVAWRGRVGSQLTTAAYTATSDRVLYASLNVLKLWHPGRANGAAPTTLPYGHSAGITSLAVCASTGMAASGDLYGEVRLWDVSHVA